MDIYAPKRGRRVRRSCCCAAAVAIYRSHQFAEKKVYTERLCTVYGNNVNKGRTDSCGAVQRRAFRYVYIILYRQNKHAAAVCKNFVVLLPLDLLYIHITSDIQLRIYYNDCATSSSTVIAVPQSRVSLPRGRSLLFTV